MSETAIFSMGVSQSVNGLIDKYNQAKDIKNQARIASSEAEATAYVLRKKAEEAKFIGMKKANKAREDASQFAGGQAVSYAGQGVDVGTGSAAQVQSDTIEKGQINALQIESDAMASAYAYKTKADSVEALAKANRKISRRKARVTLATGGADFASGVGYSSYLAYGKNKKTKE